MSKKHMNKKGWVRVGPTLCLVIAVCSIIVSAQVAGPSGKRPSLAADVSFNQKLLTVLPNGYESVLWQKIVVGKGGRKVAYLAKRGAKPYVVINGVKQPEFDEITGLTVSPDGTKVAYIATVNKGLYPGSSYISDYKNFQNTQQSFVVTNGVKGPAFPYIQSLRLDRNGIISYIVSELVLQDAVVNHIQSSPKIVVNGRPFVIGSRLIVNGKKIGEVYWGIHGVMSIENGERLVYRATGNLTGNVDCSRACIVEGNQATPTFEVSEDPIFWGKDGKEIAYAMRGCLNSGYPCNPRGYTVFGTRQEQIANQGLAYSLAASPDGTRIAYVVSRGKTQQKSGQLTVVVDGKEVAEFKSDSLPTFVFSPDSRRLAYRIIEEDKALILIDNKVAARLDSDWIGGLVFSQNATNLAFDMAIKESDPAKKYSPRHQVVILDEKVVIRTGELVDAVLTPLYFLPNGESVAYGARIGRQIWWKVLKLK